MPRPYTRKLKKSKESALFNIVANVVQVVDEHEELMGEYVNKGVKYKVNKQLIFSKM